MAICLKLAAPPSDEEIVEISERNPQYQLERSATGELIVTPIGGEASRREVELGAQLYLWAKQDGHGVAFSPSTGFHMPDGSLLSPDCSWLRWERWEALTREERKGFPPLCPDAVFEIVPAPDPFTDPRAKMRSYLANGARLAVLIDPDRRAVEIFAPDREPQVVESARSFAFAAVLPGFALDLEPIFSTT